MKTPKKDYHDRPIAEIQRMMNDVRAKGGKSWIKWTCPKCGERCLSTDPDTINLGGYQHDACGGVYTGALYGLMVLLPLGRKKPEL